MRLHTRHGMSALKFYPLKVKDINKTTSDCSVVEFEVPEVLQPEFSFIQGQHLTLRATIAGQEIRRSYSLCSSPLDKKWKIAVKKIEGGLFSGFVNDSLKAGDTLEVMHPNGNFFVSPAPDEARHYVAFAAGSGITPVFSMIKTHLELEPKARFSLYYINQTVASIILKEEIEALKNKYLQRFDAYFFLTQEEQETSVFNGRIDREKLEEICRYFLEPASADHFFLCGPEPMIFLIRDFLKEKGVSAEKIHFELFHSFAGQAKIQARKQQINKGALVEVSLKEGGKTTRFQMARGGESILDAALKRNSALPFACKGGVCCTCKAKLISGEVNMEVNYALEKEQLDAGYILTCQAFPLSEEVMVDFDQ